MKTPHKHAEIIKAWADGETIEFLTNESSWKYTATPIWLPELVYRVKPEPALSKTAEDMISNLILTCTRVSHAIYNDLSDRTSRENNRDEQAASLKRYILSLEQAVLNTKTN